MMKIGKIRRRHIAFGVVIFIALAILVRIIWTPNYGYFDGPEPLTPNRVVTTFPDGKAAYTVEVATGQKIYKKGGSRSDEIIEHQIERIRVLCNGKVIADFVPSLNVAVEFKTIRFARRDNESDIDGCSKSFQVAFDPLDDLGGDLDLGDGVGQARDRVVFNFHYGDVIVRNIGAAPSLAASRIVHEFNLVHFVKLDVKLAAGRVDTIAFDCGEGSLAPVKIDSPAPVGAFGLLMTVVSSQGTGPCHRPSRVTIVGAAQSESRAFLFDGGQRLTKSGSPSGDFDVVPYKPRAKKFWESWPKWLVPPRLQQDAWDRQRADPR